MHYEGAPNDAVWSMQRDESVGDIDGGNTSRTSFDVTQISYMALGVVGGAVILL